MADLYKRIEALCKERGISITKMCTESGVSRGTIGDLGHGKTKSLSAKTLNLLAKYFDVTVDFLLGTEKDQADDGLVNGDAELTEYLQGLQSRPEMKMLFHTFKDATKEQIEAIVLAWEARNNIKGE